MEVRLGAAIACAATLFAATVSADGYGPTQWTQYRMSPTNNAVYQNGAEALPADQFRTGNQVRANPVVIGNRLYIGNHGGGGMFAFDIKTGKTLWHDDNPHFRHAPNWIHSDMIYVNGRIFVGYGNRFFKSATVRGTGKSGVLAVDPETGATLWDHETVGEVMPTPAYWKGTLYVATGGGDLTAIDPEDGQRLWHLKLPGWVSMSSPSVQDGMLYVGALNSVVGVDLEKRSIRWTYKEDGSFTDVPTAVSPEGTVVITAMKSRGNMSEGERTQFPLTRGDAHFIYALDGETGELLWKDLLGAGASQENNTSGAPTIADGRVYVGSPYALSLQAYDLETGERLWEYPVGTKVKGAPAIHEGRVFFGDTSGFLHVLDAETGEPPKHPAGGGAPKKKLGGMINAARNVALAPGGPVVINDNVFVGSQDRFVYSVSIPEWLGTEKAGAGQAKRD